MSPLTVQPLKSSTSTRLVRLQPSSVGSALEATVFEVNLDSNHCPQYECLSYTWGDPNITPRYMSLNDKPFEIRQNLDQALCRLRLSDKKRILWVDALSISQTDLDEKARQVKMIGEIFKRAKRVLAWVGEHEDGSEMLFETSSKATVSERKPLSFRYLFGKDDSISEYINRVHVWAKFLTRPYWTRTWIIQEIVSAQELLVCCGGIILDWKTLIQVKCSTVSSLIFDDIDVASRRFRKYIDAEEAESFGIGKASVERLVTSRRSYRNTKEIYGNLMYSLTAVAYTECFDPKDRIYAILSLESDVVVRERIDVDYTISMPELYVRVLKVMAEVYTGRTMAQVLIKILMMENDAIEIVDILLHKPEELNMDLLEATNYILHQHSPIEYQPFDTSNSFQYKKDHLLKWYTKHRNLRHIQLIGNSEQDHD